MSTNFHTNVGRISGYSCFPTVSDGFRPVSDLFGVSTNFHTNVGSVDIMLLSYSFRRFQTCFRPLWDVHKFPYKCRISGYSCFPTVSDGFHKFPYKCRISGYSCFPTVSDGFRPVFRPLWGVHKFPYKRRISGYSCFPTVSNGFRPVSDPFGMSTNFHTNVGPVDIAFPTVSDGFRTCFRPLWDVHKCPYKCRISG